jgi:hypothetical protein
MTHRCTCATISAPEPGVAATAQPNTRSTGTGPPKAPKKRAIQRPGHRHVDHDEDGAELAPERGCQLEAPQVDVAPPGEDTDEGEHGQRDEDERVQREGRGERHLAASRGSRASCRRLGRADQRRPPWGRTAGPRRRGPPPTQPRARGAARGGPCPLGGRLELEAVCNESDLRRYARGLRVSRRSHRHRTTEGAEPTQYPHDGERRREARCPASSAHDRSWANGRSSRKRPCRRCASPAASGTTTGAIGLSATHLRDHRARAPRSRA